MKTYSFFSYKGGVGRTLALTNIAKQLVEFNKSVFIIDFDLEAPGVHYKLGDYLKNVKIEKGIVDYIYEYSNNNTIDDIEHYTYLLSPYNPKDANLWFLPAGNASDTNYWERYARINWHKMFYEPNGSGLRFFLNLKSEIQKKYNPDYLFIDSRTGITSISGISLKILSDESVLLFVNNAENIDGTKQVLTFLNNENNIEKKPQKHHLVLSRIPFVKQNDKAKFNREYLLKERLLSEFKAVSPNLSLQVYSVHTDERLQMNEKLAFFDSGNEEEANLFLEHYLLFEKLFKDDFSEEEWLKRENSRKAIQLYSKALKENDLDTKISLLSAAIDLKGDDWRFFLERGSAYSSIWEISKSKADIETCLKYNPASKEAYIKKSWLLVADGKYKEAIGEIIKAKEDTFSYSWNYVQVLGHVNKENALDEIENVIKKYPDRHELLNDKANFLMELGKTSDAEKSILSAISISPHPVYYGTLAEIKLLQDDRDGFFTNLRLALNNNMDATYMRSVKFVYEKVRNDPEFIEFMRSYNLNVEDIFHDGKPKGL